MAKISRYFQVTLPKDIIDKVDTDFTSNIWIYVNVKHEQLYLDNPSPKNRNIPSLGKITIGKSRNFQIPAMVRQIYNLNIGDDLTFYIFDGKIAFKRVFTKRK